MKYWILVGHTPIEVDRDEWSRWFETGNRHVSKTTVTARNSTYRISTVFLGIDHDFRNPEVPELFETMVFADIDGEDPWDNYQVRSRSYLEAKKMHRMVEIQVASNKTP